MKDFGSVGRRLRLLRFLAFLAFAVSILIGVVGVGDNLSHPPITKPNRADDGTLRRDFMSPDEPQYIIIQRDRTTTLMFFLTWSAGFAGVGALAWLASRKPPIKETLLLAKTCGGILTLPDVSTAMNIDPRLAALALRELQKLNLATPRWLEIRKNLWEFPDYLELPTSEATETPTSNPAGRSMQDLLNARVATETTPQTPGTFRENARNQPEPDPHAVIIATQ